MFDVHGELYCTTASRQYFSKQPTNLEGSFYRCFDWGICFFDRENRNWKSSLIKTLYADLPLEHGMGSIVGYDLTNIKQKDIPYLRRKLGLFFKILNCCLIARCFENLRFVLKATGWKDKSKIEARIDKVLTEVGMGEVALKYPFELSGGEQQRVAIARALLNTPESSLPMNPLGT